MHDDGLLPRVGCLLIPYLSPYSVSGALYGDRTEFNNVEKEKTYLTITHGDSCWNDCIFVDNVIIMGLSGSEGEINLVFPICSPLKIFGRFEIL